MEKLAKNPTNEKICASHRVVEMEMKSFTGIKLQMSLVEEIDITKVMTVTSATTEVRGMAISK